MPARGFSTSVAMSSNDTVPGAASARLAARSRNSAVNFACERSRWRYPGVSTLAMFCAIKPCRAAAGARPQPRLDRFGADHRRVQLQHARTLDDVLQLAHVPRPIVLLQKPHRLRLDVPERSLFPLGDQMQEMPA